MATHYNARIFRNGRSRAVRIPAAINLPGDQVTIRQDGRSVVIEPTNTGDRADGADLSLGQWLATLDPLLREEWMPDIEDYPPEPVDL